MQPKTSRPHRSIQSYQNINHRSKFFIWNQRYPESQISRKMQKEIKEPLPLFVLAKERKTTEGTKSDRNTL
uniref:Uncharacterized protein n=1 Tax=Arundo donax TaxID=35708 RepID=A0A0A9GAM5_ARUDO